MLRQEAEQQAKRIPVRAHSLRAGAFVLEEMVHEEGLHQRTEEGGGGHGVSPWPVYRRKRSAAPSSNCGVAVRYQ